MAERLKILLPFYDINLGSFYDLKVDQYFQRRTSVKSSLEIQYVFVHFFCLESPPDPFAHSVSHLEICDIRIANLRSCSPIAAPLDLNSASLWPVGELSSVDKYLGVRDRLPRGF